MAAGVGTFGPVRVAWADAADVGAIPLDVLEAFGAQQVRRYASLTGDAAHRFLVGRAMLSDLIADLTDQPDLGFTSTCDRCGADHGRPRLERAPIAVSVSYTGSMVAVAAARHADAAAVGVDIEQVPIAGARSRLTDLAALFAPAPPPDIEGWTLIEAALKADGRGVTIDLSEVEVSGSGRVPGSRAVRIPGRNDAVAAAVIAGPSGFVLSAATVPAAEHPL
ncbi:MAG: hypothetical protein ACXWZG_00850 [Microbacterium sp.]